MKYDHVLALYPYFKDTTATMGVFPPTGLEYVATNMIDLVGKVTLLDLRYENEYQNIEILSNFINNEIDLLCISITWNSQFNSICNLINKLPHEVTTVIGGYKATEEVEFLFEKCPNIDLIVRGEGEETIREVVENTAGYYFNRIGGAVYSDRYDRNALKQIRNRIRSGFYDFQQIRLILGKVYKSRLLTISELAQIFARLPNILFRLLLRRVEKKGRLTSH